MLVQRVNFFIVRVMSGDGSASVAGLNCELLTKGPSTVLVHGAGP